MRCRRYCHTALQLRRCHTLINCYFDGAYTSVTSHPAYLHDYGQILRVFDLDLPAVVEAHFSLEESGKSILRMGACEKGITHIPIPDSCLEETGSFYCYIFSRKPKKSIRRLSPQLHTLWSLTRSEAETVRCVHADRHMPMSLMHSPPGGA